MTVADSPIAEIVRAVTAGEASAREVVLESLRRLEALQPRLNAFLDVPAEQALAAAEAIDCRRHAGDVPGVLAGVPVAVKDNICTGPEPFGGRTTCASRMLADYRSPFNATAVERLAAAGAIVIGKTNLDEFAMGSSGENSAFGPTRNPWDPTRVPGGSSSGSAAAVAAGIVPAALGSDTGGSIRQPAGFCGVVGIKPTYGRVSRWGLVAFASSLDQIGTFGRTVADAAALLQVIAGGDQRDSTCSPRPVPDLLTALDRPVPGAVIGVPRQARQARNHPAVGQALEQAIRILTDAGASVTDVDLPHVEDSIAAYYIVATAEASSNLARYDGVRYGFRAGARPNDDPDVMYARTRGEGFGAEVKRRIMLGTFVLSAGYYEAYYITALRARRVIRDDFARAFAAGCHALLMPASPEPAFRLGERAGDPLAMYLADLYTVGVNLAGLPAISLPVQLTPIGGVALPIGVQLIGPMWSEPLLLRLGRMLESARGSFPRAPL